MIESPDRWKPNFKHNFKNVQLAILVIENNFIFRWRDLWTQSYFASVTWSPLLFIPLPVLPHCRATLPFPSPSTTSFPTPSPFVFLKPPCIFLFFLQPHLIIFLQGNFQIRAYMKHHLYSQALFQNFLPLMEWFAYLLLPRYSEIFEVIGDCSIEFGVW